MTAEELHEILDNENLVLKPNEIINTIYELISDIISESASNDITDSRRAWYSGELNGFQIAIDLLAHCEGIEEGTLNNATKE